MKRQGQKFVRQPLGEVLEFFNGRAIKPGGHGGYPVYGSNGIIGGSDEYRYRDGIIIGRVGAYCGSVAYCAGRFWASDNTIVAQPRRQYESARYYYYVLENAKLNRYAGGSAQPLLTQTSLARLSVPVAPLVAQSKILATLSAYDDLIEKNARRIKILEEMARAIYREWFVEFRAPGVKLRRATADEKKIAGREEFPEGWGIKRLSEVVETQYGYTESASEEKVGPKFVRGMDINKASHIQWDTVPYCRIGEEGYPRYKLGVGDVLVVRMADPGKVGIVEKNIDAVFASLIRARINGPELSPYYLFYFMASDRYQGYITGASTGTTRRSASAGVITDIDILIPSESIRERFEGSIRELRWMVNNLLDRNANLRRTRDFLLPKLVSGEVNVEDLVINVGEEGKVPA